MTQFTNTNIPFFAAREAQIKAQAPALDALADLLDGMSVKDYDFACSLLANAKRGPLSEKQMYWVGVLTQRASAPKAQAPKIDLGRARALITTAMNNGLRNAMVKFDGVKVSVPKAGSVNYGKGLYLTVDGTFVGTVAEDGSTKVKQGAEAMFAVAVERVQQFSCDPAARLVAHGKDTGSCCFCSQRLTDDGSKEVGYGPICAEKYGLPHTPKGARKSVKVVETKHEDFVEGTHEDASEYELDGGRDADGYGWEDRALAGAYSAR